MEEHQCLIATLNSKFSHQVLKCWMIFAYVIRHSFAYVRAILLELCVLRKYVDKLQFCDTVSLLLEYIPFPTVLRNKLFLLQLDYSKKWNN